jgi:hypothetical protein
MRFRSKLYGMETLWCDVDFKGAYVALARGVRVRRRAHDRR